MKPNFNLHTFLSTIGKGRDMISFNKKDTIFAQADPTDGLFFIQTGKVQLSVVSGFQPDFGNGNAGKDPQELSSLECKEL